ncbi:MAG: SPFH domain-containing protein [Bryobacterales bacterium]|nr:SPFH domain-containing protein [Bryobacterales bacterium]
MIKEIRIAAASGYAMLLADIAIAGAGLYVLVNAKRMAEYGVATMLLCGVGLIVAALVVACGFFTVHPNKAVVMQLFGKYVGTVKDEGLRWANPLYTKHSVSLRTRNFETNRLKVNDFDGNPIEIGAVVVWKVVDSAEASFQVDNYENYVNIQSEAALRNLATHYSYDSHEKDGLSLRANTAEIAARLQHEIQERLAVAGVSVVEARISHLAYAPEIAAAMLQRQQASAIIAARQKIVEGAVGMVEMALDMLSQRSVVNLDEERKASMVSNLLVVLCGERSTQPIINAGTLHH